MPRVVKPVLEGDDDWQAQHDADTLMKAEEIRSQPERHEKAHKHVKKKFHIAARAMTAGKKGKPNRFTARAKLQDGK